MRYNFFAAFALSFLTDILATLLPPELWEVKEFDEDAYDTWSELSMEQKLPYLLDQQQIYVLFTEFQALTHTKIADDVDEVDDTMDKPAASNPLTGQIISQEPALHRVNLLQLRTAWTDMQDIEAIDSYFLACDTNLDATIDFPEYILCRGYFDLHGNPYEDCEYHVLESILIHDFEVKMNSHNFISKKYKYDEEGNIID